MGKTTQASQQQQQRAPQVLPPLKIEGSDAVEGTVGPDSTLESRATLPSMAFTVWTEGDMPDGPVLMVVRGMPSKFHVMCQLVGTEQKDLVCHVRVAANFRRGMMIFGARPAPEMSARAWVYRGKLPRRPGRW